jgi:hypothetical protein
MNFKNLLKGKTMKTAFTIFFALIVSASAFAVGGSYDATGAVKTQNKKFTSVVNSASATLTVGEAVCADLTADDGIAVDYCTATGLPLGLIVTSSCPVGARCLLQTEGVFEAAVLDVTQGNAVAGDLAYAHTDGSVFGDTTPADGISAFGVFLDSASASGTIQVLIK